MIQTEVAMQLKRIHKRITGIMQSKIDEYELTFGLLHLMMLIHKNPDANQKDLAKEMRFTEGAMSGSVKRLLNLDMLEQVPLESDMRYNRLLVTPKGKSMIEDCRHHLIKKYEDIFNGFDEDELIQLNNLLLKVNKNLDNMKNTKNSEE